MNQNREYESATPASPPVRPRSAGYCSESSPLNPVFCSTAPETPSISSGVAIPMKGSAPGELRTGNDVCAIVVTYHPDAELPERLSRILFQVRALVIVDNGSGETAVRTLRDL